MPYKCFKLRAANKKMSVTFTIHAAGPHQKQVFFQSGPVPEKYNRYLLPGGEPVWVQLKGAVLLFQQFIIGSYSLLFCHFLVDNPVKFIVWDTSPGSRAYLMLLGKMSSRYRVTRQWGTLREGYYEVLHQPFLKKEIKLRNDIYSYVILRYQDETGNNDTFSGRMPLEILLSEYLTEQSISNFKSQEEQLVILDRLAEQVMKKEVFTGRYKFTPESVFRIWQAGQRIKDYPDEKGILQAQFANAHLTEDLYLEGFRILFGLSPKRYHTKIRMEAAERMLTDDPLVPLLDVADFLGYSTTADLVEAYEKYYGKPPR
jgi:AraC-like DNA-binding protein